MAASTTSLSSSRGFSSKAQFVAGSRRPVSKRIVSRRNKNDVIVRAAAGKKEEEVSGENADESSTIAGKAVSAVVAAAISLSSAGQAAVAQVVRSSFCRCVRAALPCVFDSSTDNKKARDTISKREHYLLDLDRIFRINWKSFAFLSSLLFFFFFFFLFFLVYTDGSNARFFLFSCCVNTRAI